MQPFEAQVPNLCSPAVKPLRTKDTDALVQAIAALVPPFAPDVAAELVALGFGHEDGNVRKKAMALVTKHVKDLPKFKAAYKTLANADQHIFNERVRAFKHPYRLDIAKALLFHREVLAGISFEEDAAMRALILDEAVARAKRDNESELHLGEVYWSWNGSSGWATDLDLHQLPKTLFGELAARRKQHPFDGVSFYGCSLTDLPATIVEAAPWLKSLSLGYNHFTELPDVLWKLTNLESLDILGSEIVEIPDQIRKLTKLRSLDIGNMKKLKEIPASVCKLDKLEYLRIGNGSIRKIPDAIGGMKSLREIELQSTQVSKLPAIMFDMPNLEKINVRWSKVDDATIEKLKAAGKEVET